MSLYSIGKFIHVASDIGLMIGIGVWLVAYAALRHTNRVEQVRAITGLMFFSDVFYAVTGILLLGSGVYMTLNVWGFTTAWIDVALATLFLIVPVGPLFAEPRMKAIASAAKDAPDGPISAELLAQIHNPILGTALYVMMAGVIGIVFLMTVKPELVISILAIVIAVAVGAAFSLPLWAKVRRHASSA